MADFHWLSFSTADLFCHPRPMLFLVFHKVDILSPCSPFVSFSKKNTHKVAVFTFFVDVHRQQSRHCIVILTLQVQQIEKIQALR